MRGRIAVSHRAIAGARDYRDAATTTPPTGDLAAFAGGAGFGEAPWS